MKKKILLPISFFLIAALQLPVTAQPFKLLKDINESPWWSSTVGPRNMIAVNDLLFFRQDTGLWRTDGTPGGTIFLQRITPENMGSANGTLFLSGGTIFIYSGPGTGSPVSLDGIWKSDGTPEGTVQVKDMGTANNMTGVTNTLFFTATDGIAGNELWKSDGTEVGTVMVKDITPGPDGSSIGNLFNVNGTLFFNVGGALWKSDGTGAGTILVKNNITLTHPFLLPSGTFYFVNNGNELWKSDGTDAGTVFIKQISTASPINTYPQFTFVNGAVFFIGNMETAEAALWKTDGTNAGTVLVKDITPQYDGISSLVNLNNVLYFTAIDGIDGGALWKCDGTEVGTIMVKNSIGVGFLTPVNGVLLFSNNDGLKGQELWKSDGTEAGTILVKDIYEGSGGSNPFITDARATEPPAGLGYAVVNNTLFFSATNGLNGRELWKSNGSAATTSMVKDIYRPNVSGNPRFFTKVNGTVYFTAFDRFSSPFLFHHDELYKTDGTLSGTGMVRDLYGLGSGLPTHLAEFDGAVYFSATDGLGFELFKSDGTYNGTVKVKDINPVNGENSNPADLTSVNGLLFFSANDGTHGSELWKTDGTEAGTVIVKDINPGSTATFNIPSNLVNVNGILYFTADDGANGTELWTSDGTAGGTLLVKDINAGSNSSNPFSLTNINGTLYFAASDGVNGNELWKSDGTAAGTVLVKDINAGINSSSPFSFTNINGVLYFAADDGVGGHELWKSDGTAAGTMLVKDINNGINSSNPTSLTNLNGLVVFSADDGSGGRELWKSNGTEAGTVLIKDIKPGGSGNPSVFTKVGSNLLFAADDGAHGNEIWISNGTGAGTRLMQDIEPGNVGSDPSEIIEVNGRVLASVFTSYFGREVWVTDAPAEIPLPLEFLEFKGSIVNGDGQLQWKTENEDNTNEFIVERSTDGRYYNAVGSVTAANSTGIHHYDFTDVSIVSLGAPVIYYRLKQTDIDGRYTYSNIVTLAIDNSKSFVILYPNPVKNKINLAINVPRKEKLQWQLTDNTGRTVKRGIYDLSPGSTAVTIDIPNLSSGIYFMQLNGSTLQQVIKLVKQ
ncbi:MAG: ELWxxDGT repeat protein [Chitinophagaceae bacterium]